MKRLAALVQEACDRDDVLENKVRVASHEYAKVR